MNTSRAAILTLLLVAGLLVACGPSEEELNATATQNAANIFATLTAEAPTPTHTPTITPTPTPSPTNTPTPTATATATPRPSATPTITPTPTPDLSSMMLTLDDLPPGFEEVPGEMMEFFAGGGITGVFDSSAAFMLQDPFHFLLQVTNEMSGFEANIFDTQASDPEVLATASLTGMGIPSLEDENVLAYAPIEELEEVGDLASGARIDVLVQDAPFTIYLVALRRGDFGVVLMLMTYVDTEPEVQVTDLAGILDQRILEEGIAD